MVSLHNGILQRIKIVACRCWAVLFLPRPACSPAPATQAMPVPCTCPTPFLPRCPADHLPGTLDEGITPRQGLSGTAVRGGMATKGLRGHVHRPNRLSPPSPQLIAFTASWPRHREALCNCPCLAILYQLAIGARYLAPRAFLFLQARPEEEDA
jgi:hypothetical protein